MIRSRAATPRLLHPLVIWSVVAVSLLLTPALYTSYRDLLAARQRERLLVQRIEETEIRSRDLELFKKRLEADPTLLERLAREDLGMVLPGDVVIVLPEEEGKPDPREAPGTRE